MNTILQQQLRESRVYFPKFYVILISAAQVHALNGILLHNYFRHGVFSMTILDLLSARIIEQYPQIKAEELYLRLELAHELIKYIRK